MRVALGALALLVLVTGCGSTSAPHAASQTRAEIAAKNGMLSPYWRTHHTDAWIGDTMRAVCKDLKHNDSRPQLEALALTKLKGVSVSDAESLVSAGIVTTCPAAAKIPRAWGQG